MTPGHVEVLVSRRGDEAQESETLGLPNDYREGRTPVTPG